MAGQQWWIGGTWLLAVAVDWGIAGRLQLAGVRPDVLLLVTIVTGLVLGRTRGMLLGFAYGLLQGVQADRGLAAFAITLVLAGYAGGSLRRLFFVDSVGVNALATGLLAFAASLGLGLALQGWHGQVIWQAALQAAWCLVLSPPPYWLLRRATPAETATV